MSTDTATALVLCTVAICISVIVIVAMLTGNLHHVADISGCAAGCFR